MEIDYEKEVTEFVKLNFGEAFKFRTQQLEVIIDILKSYFEDPNGIYLLDAPTGSGKSYIAIVVAGVLTKFQKRGYILASDLVLHKQYVSDFKKLQLWNWGNVKGVDNYKCAVNGERFSIGDCKNKGISYDSAETLSCFKHCEYLRARKKAIRAGVTLLTYPYALIQRNYVDEKSSGKGKSPPFPQRDFVVCDEAHKLLDIVQNHFSPIISTDVYKKTTKLIENSFDIGLASLKIKTADLEKLIKQIYQEEDHGNLLSHLKEVTGILERVIKPIENARELAGKQFENEAVPKEWLTVFNLIDWVKDCYCKLQDYCEIIDQVGLEKMVKNPNENSIVFNCIDEYYLLKKHFFDKFGFKLLMTATMGKPIDFMKAHGINKAKHFKMDSHFNWEQSPIFYYPGKKMSAKYIDDNFNWALSTLTEIFREHQNDSGIIHTVSYDLAKRVWSALPNSEKKRVLLYKGSEEKEVMLKKMSKKRGAVLMGPSLLEGLNLIDDLSRFQVFMKVPYPYLGDKYVEAKLNFSQKWYSWKTAISVLQGTGRSIRTPSDWAVTYLLDGCFSDLFQAAGDQFPIEFRSRMKIRKTSKTPQ